MIYERLKERLFQDSKYVTFQCLQISSAEALVGFGGITSTVQIRDQVMGFSKFAIERTAMRSDESINPWLHVRFGPQCAKPRGAMPNCPQTALISIDKR